MATLAATGSTTNAGNSVADAAIAFALAQVGKPYVWGATGPNSFDCSGLIQAAYKHAGLSLSRTTYTMIREGTEVTRAQLLPGDLIFPNPGHVQLYVGGGKVCEAAQSGIPIRVVPIWGFWRARRVTAPGTGVTGGASTAANADTATSTFGGAGVADSLSWITTAHNWLRIAEFIAGVALIFVVLKSIGS